MKRLLLQYSNIRGPLLKLFMFYSLCERRNIHQVNERDAKPTCFAWEDRCIDITGG